MIQARSRVPQSPPPDSRIIGLTSSFPTHFFPGPPAALLHAHCLPARDRLARAHPTSLLYLALPGAKRPSAASQPSATASQPSPARPDPRSLAPPTGAVAPGTPGAPTQAGSLHPFSPPNISVFFHSRFPSPVPSVRQSPARVRPRVCPVCSRPSDSDPGSATFRSCFTLHSARDRHLHPRPRPRPRPLHLASASATTHLFASDTPRPSRPP